MTTSNKVLPNQQQVIKDIRPGYGGQISIINNRAYYCGSRIHELIKDESNPRNQHHYTIIQHGSNIGSIALSNDDYKLISGFLHCIEFTRINNDVNGNPRYVCHFLELISDNDREEAKKNKADHFGIDTLYKIAVKKANKIGGRKYHNKQYGGGIVFQSYNTESTEIAIKELKNS